MKSAKDTDLLGCHDLRQLLSVMKGDGRGVGSWLKPNFNGTNGHSKQIFVPHAFARLPI